MKTIIHPFRDTFLSRHHMLPKVRKLKGSGRPENILMLWRDRHNVFHEIFGNFTFMEIISNWNKFQKHWGTKKWKFLFHDLSEKEARNLLKRTYRMKKRR